MAGPVSAPLMISARLRHPLFVLLSYSLLFTVFFSPVLFTGRLLAPGGGRLGDGLLYHLAFFQSSKTFWDSLLASGFPMTADPQVMAWYPPSLLLSLMPGGWNIFVVSAYVLASCFAYGYVYALTRSRLASLAAGVIYGMSGFMIAHLGHTSIIHTAVWLPLIIWSLEMLRQRFSRGWFALGSVAVACCVLAGHSQIVAYTLALSGGYALALGWRAEAGRLRFYFFALLLALFGLGLSALQILPTAELAGLSARAEFGFSDFTSYSLPLKQASLLLFPAVLGGLARYGTTPYFGAWNLTELTGYVGLLPLALAVVAVLASDRRAVVIFWLSVCGLALLLTLGPATPLARLTFQLPVVSRFRAPARHFIEMAFAVSVLSGLGLEAIIRRLAGRRDVLKALAIVAALVLGGLLLLVVQHGSLFTGDGGAVVRLNALPWANAAVATPLLIFLATVLVLLFWQKAPGSRFRSGALLCILIIDLSSFGWFYSWHDYSPSREVLVPPSFAAHYRSVLQASGQRILPVRGTLGTTSEMPPNLSRLWAIPSAGGYSPLSLTRMNRLLSALPDASVGPSWKEAGNQSLNLLAVRYLFLPRAQANRDAGGILWQSDDMDLRLGKGCGEGARDSVKLTLPAPVEASALGIVSRLSCAVNVAEGEEVARLILTDADGRLHTIALHAGTDTSEWTFDSPGIRPQMRHARAPVFRSFPARMNDESYEAHDYLSKLRLDRDLKISGLEFQWTGAAGSISIEKVSLINEATNQSKPLDSLTADPSRWRLAEEAGEALVYENLRALPRVRLANEVLSLSPDAALEAIKTSRLPDGRPYDPERLALVEEPLSLPSNESERSGAARVTFVSDTVMEVQTSSQAPSFLVTSDAFYPGWRATIDGSPVRLFRADYALRGVPLPAGNHLVRFEFRPRSFSYGAALSLLSLLALAAFLGLGIMRGGQAEKEILS